MRRALLTLFFLLLALSAHAQGDSLSVLRAHGTGGTRTAGGQASVSETKDTAVQMPKGVIYHTDLPDSVLQGSVFGFRRAPYDVKIMEVSHPRFDPTAVQCDPLFRLWGNTRRDGGYNLSAGGMGHPHYNLFPDHSNPLGLSFKPDIFPAFRKNPENITFYQVQRPYTLLAYHSSLDKDYQVHVTHTQNINERWNIALDYHLFSPEGVYANSSAVDHLLDINTNYYSPDSRYQLRAGWLWQRFSLGENGGLSNDSLFIHNSSSKPGGYPVVSTSASSRTTDHTLFVNQSYNTVRQVPWYRERIVLSPSDTADRLDTVRLIDTLYPSEPKVLNTGVFGLNMQYDRHKYRGVALPAGSFDSLLTHTLGATLFWTNDAYLDRRTPSSTSGNADDTVGKSPSFGHWPQGTNPLKVTLGLRPSITVSDLDTSLYAPARYIRTALYPFAHVVAAPWQKSQLALLAECEPFHQEYNLDLRFDYRPDERNSLILRGSAKRQDAYLLYHILPQATIPGTADVPVSKALASDNSPLTTVPQMQLLRAEAEYDFRDLLRFRLAAAHIQSNPYLSKSSSGQLQVGNTAAGGQLLQASVALRLQPCSWLHLHTQQLLQHSTNDVVRVPLWASKNSLFADFHLFHRALRTQVGVDLRYHTSFLADAYDPSLGIFYRQDDTPVGNYLYADFFINLQVKRASIYLKAGHINSFLESEAHYFSIPHYPENPFALLYGIVWQFFD